ncbi:MAG: methionyl-tRNA formyltransferase [Clostridiales bacterium]|nr:methionyl-tRNA formyltransferase [Clostridiales bacterium]
MRVIFMGTPDFAVGTLDAINEAGHELALVVTQPDRPKGRGGAMSVSPVKEWAISHDVEVFQPVKIREPENIDFLKNFEPDIIVVAAFGQILPGEILDLPRYCCVNVHASLLPKYRGASPIQWAILDGEPVTGVTTMRMDEGLDTGDIIRQEEIAIARGETAGSLFCRLADLGARLCVETMDSIENGTALYTPQNAIGVTYTSTIKKDMGNLDWSRPAAELERMVRGLDPWPGAYTYLNGKMLKIWGATVQENLDKENSEAKPGTVVRAGKNGIAVQTGDGILNLNIVQIQDKKRMDAASFLNGNRVEEGTLLRS